MADDFDVREFLDRARETALRSFINVPDWQQREVKLEIHSEDHAGLGEHVQLNSWLPGVDNSGQVVRFQSPFSEVPQPPNPFGPPPPPPPF